MPKRIDGEQRKIDIMEKSLQIFTDRGFDNTSMQTIADGCGLSRTNLYNYFQNKEDIYSFVVHSAYEQLRASVHHIEDEKLSPLTCIKKTIRTSLSTAYRLRHIIVVILEHSLKHKREIEKMPDGGNVLTDEEKGLLEQNCEMQQFFERKLREGVAVNELIPHNFSSMAKILHSLISSCIIQFSLSSHLSYEADLESIMMLLEEIRNFPEPAVL